MFGVCLKHEKIDKIMAKFHKFTQTEKQNNYMTNLPISEEVKAISQ